MTARRRASLALAALLLAACGDEPPAGPQRPLPTDPLLTIDGITITFGDVEPILAFLAASHPEAGRKTVMQMVLEQYTVPLRLAERAFPTERAGKRRLAADLRQVATNAYELDGAAVETRERKRYARMQPELPVSMFLFDPLMTGGVSDPIPVPRGFVVAAAHEYVPTPLVVEDMVEATQVGFFTHPVGEWRDWIQAEQARLADKVTYVHPDYREALPTWCKPPKPPKTQ